MTPQSQSGLISKVLASAVSLWLKSQVESVEQLTVEVNAGDRNILSGQIPELRLQAQNIIYQGIHLTDITITARDIATNLPQVLRGKPLKLKEAIPITAQASLSAQDLNASLSAPLLEPVIRAFLADLLRSAEIDTDPAQLHTFQSALAQDQLTLSAQIPTSSGQDQEVALRTQIHLSQPNRLSLSQVQWLTHARAKRGLPLTDLEGYSFDLGPDTDISSLSLAPEALQVEGRFKVYP
jgi:LmeA-like phospholipid-binding